MDSSQLDDSEHSDLFASPSQTPKPTSTRSQPHDTDAPKTPPANPPAVPARSFDAEEAREASLRRELEGVRNINAVIEGVIRTLDRAKGNMGTVTQTVANASTLLNTWTRILSQTEHNQRLILDPRWNGASADLAEVEAEAAARQQAAERRAAEEERRREEARRKAVEEEMRRAAAAPSATTAPTSGRGASRGTRARGRVYSSGYGRGAYSSGYGSTDTTASSIGTGRGTSGIGRGLGTSRAGRARGTR